METYRLHARRQPHISDVRQRVIEDETNRARHTPHRGAINFAELDEGGQQRVQTADRCINGANVGIAILLLRSCGLTCLQTIQKYVQQPRCGSHQIQMLRSYERRRLFDGL